MSVLRPDNAWLIGEAVVDNNSSLYVRAKAAAMRAGELILVDSPLRLISFERESLLAYIGKLEALPYHEENDIE